MNTETLLQKIKPLHILPNWYCSVVSSEVEKSIGLMNWTSVEDNGYYNAAWTLPIGTKLVVILWLLPLFPHQCHPLFTSPTSYCFIIELQILSLSNMTISCLPYHNYVLDIVLLLTQLNFVIGISEFHILDIQYHIL